MNSNAKLLDRRIQFEVLASRLAEIDELMAFCDLKTRKDLFDNAMTFFEWAVHEVMAGRQIASYDSLEDSVQVVRFPVLDNAARKSKVCKPISVVNTDGSSDDNANGKVNKARPRLMFSTEDK